MTHSNDPEFQPCFVTCACDEEYSLEPPDFVVSKDKECRCLRDEVAEDLVLQEHLRPVSETEYAAQYRAGSGGLL